MTMWVIPEDLGNFSPKKEKNLGEQKFARLSVSNFRGLPIKLFFSSQVLLQKARVFYSEIFFLIGVDG